MSWLLGFFLSSAVYISLFHFLLSFFYLSSNVSESFFSCFSRNLFVYLLLLHIFISSILLVYLPLSFASIASFSSFFLLLRCRSFSVLVLVSFFCLLLFFIFSSSIEWTSHFAFQSIDSAVTIMPTHQLWGSPLYTMSLDHAVFCMHCNWQLNPKLILAPPLSG